MAAATAPLASSCQRWRDRASSWRPAGELFNAREAEAQVIDEATAKAFVTRHHYSGTYPAARLRVGMFWRGALAGVVVFSVPMSQQIVPKYFADLEAAAGVELGRLVLLDQVPANAESWLVARAFRLLRATLPAVRACVSYSDPIARTTAAGALVKPGHVGTVYQALNAHYRGRAAARTLLLAGDGRALCNRALSKLRADDRGAAYAYQQLRAMGAPARLPLESGRSYLARALEAGSFRQVRHPGNHVYTWRLDRRELADPAAYPKAHDRAATQRVLQA